MSKVDEDVLHSIFEKARKYDKLLMAQGRKNELACSFCGKSQSAVKKLITSDSSGLTICICDDCVHTCLEILETKPAVKVDKDNAK